MKDKKDYARIMYVVGYFVLSVAIFDAAIDFISRLKFGYPFNLGIVLSNGNTAITGFLAIIVSKSMRNTQSRLDRIEQGNAGASGDA